VTTTTTTTVPLQTAASPRVNLLPPEVLAERRLRRMKLLLAAGVLGAGAVVGGLYLAAVADVDEARHELQQTQAVHADLQEQTEAYADVPGVYASVAAAEALLEQATTEEVRWSYYLNDLSLTVPDGVWMTTVTAGLQGDAGADAAADPAAAAATTGAAPAPSAVTPTDGTAVPAGRGSVTFAGTAMNHDLVADWLEVLADQPGYEDPYLTSSTERMEGATQVVDFTTEVTVTDDALWTQYLEATGTQP
jgi:Tfp pilus assembly protein PilN